MMLVMLGASCAAGWFAHHFYGLGGVTVLVVGELLGMAAAEMDRRHHG